MYISMYVSKYVRMSVCMYAHCTHRQMCLCIWLTMPSTSIVRILWETMKKQEARGACLVYVCMCFSTFILFTYTYVCTYIKYAYIRIYICTYTYVCMYVLACMYVCAAYRRITTVNSWLLEQGVDVAKVWQDIEVPCVCTCAVMYVRAYVHT